MLWSPVGSLVRIGTRHQLARWKVHSLKHVVALVTLLLLWLLRWWWQPRQAGGSRVSHVGGHAEAGYAHGHHEATMWVLARECRNEGAHAMHRHPVGCRLAHSLLWRPGYGSSLLLLLLQHHLLLPLKLLLGHGQLRHLLLGHGWSWHLLWRQLLSVLCNLWRPLRQALLLSWCLGKHSRQTRWDLIGSVLWWSCIQINAMLKRVIKRQLTHLDLVTLIQHNVKVNDFGVHGKGEVKASTLAGTVQHPALFLRRQLTLTACLFQQSCSMADDR